MTPTIPRGRQPRPYRESGASRPTKGASRMSSLSRRLAAAPAVLVLCAATAHADLLYFKDGYVLQGKVKRNTDAEFDSAARDFIYIPKGPFFIDDGPRVVYFSGV